MRLTAGPIAASALGRLLLATPLAAQSPLDAFRDNVAAIHARDRAAYLSHYLHTPALARVGRSEEHTSELQSQSNLVCRLLLEKKKTTYARHGLHLRHQCHTGARLL